MGRRPESIAFELGACAVAAQLLLIVLRLAGVIAWPWWLVAVPWWGLAGLAFATGALIAAIALSASLFDWGWASLERRREARQLRERGERRGR